MAVISQGSMTKCCASRITQSRRTCASTKSRSIASVCHASSSSSPSSSSETPSTSSPAEMITTRRDALKASGILLSTAATTTLGLNLFSSDANRAALAAYGESANIFGKEKKGSSFVPFAGDGYAVLIPGKWNPSKEREFAGMDMRYEDNFDAVNNMSVMINKTSQSSIEGLGDLDKALGEFAYLLGTQSYSGLTQSEGGFKENRVSTAAVLDQKAETVKGKKYYEWEILTRTADGDEGGRHQLIKATVSNGNLYALKIQAGDKRWFKGAERECREAFDSFTVV